MDTLGQPSACLLPAQPDEPAARRFPTAALRRHGVPKPIPIAGSEANAAASRGDTEAPGTALASRQGNALKQRVAQEQRGVQRGTRSRLGGTSFAAGQCTLAGMELRHRLWKGPWEEEATPGLTPADLCDFLAASAADRQTSRRRRSQWAIDPRILPSPSNRSFSYKTAPRQGVGIGIRLCL